jgi:hypothetical protein
MFSYDGWNSLNYSLDEFRKPEKKLIFANSISVGIVTIVCMYNIIELVTASLAKNINRFLMLTDLLVNVAFISVVPGDEILNTNKIDETIAATFFRQLFGSEVAVRIFTALIVLSIMGTAASYVWR